jgi:hypothetical protein
MTEGLGLGQEFEVICAELLSERPDEERIAQNLRAAITAVREVNTFGEVLRNFGTLPLTDLRRCLADEVISIFFSPLALINDITDAEAMTSLRADLEAIRAIARELDGADSTKVDHAIGDVQVELDKEVANKEEVGTALGRALVYMRGSRSYPQVVGKLQIHVTRIVSLLGRDYVHLIPSRFVAREVG